MIWHRRISAAIRSAQRRYPPSTRPTEASRRLRGTRREFEHSAFATPERRRMPPSKGPLQSCESVVFSLLATFLSELAGAILIPLVPSRSQPARTLTRRGSYRFRGVRQGGHPA